jgi:predicted ATPase
LRLKAFRVENFKNVRDTDWISCGDLTVFIGKNEAGKSSILRGLSKLNPSDGEKYDPLKEFPRRRFTTDFSVRDWPVSSARFSLDQNECEELGKICPGLETTEFEVTRYYSWRLTVEFLPKGPERVAQRSAYIAMLDRALDYIQGLGGSKREADALGALKTVASNGLRLARDEHAAKPPDEWVSRTEVNPVLDLFRKLIVEPRQRDLLMPIAAEFVELKGQPPSQNQVDNASDWISARMPRFIYFDRYDVIESAVHIPGLLKQIQQTPTGARVRTTECLFKHVGLDLKRLDALGQHQPGQQVSPEIRRLLDERAIQFSSASNAMTERFGGWWEQRKHKFRYQTDGDYFRVWVSDDLDPSEIELDQRSAGMQYFFCFFIVFLVEAQEGHKNSILLLDEPGLHIHGTAQAKLIEFLEKLSADNQILYSTHSPFLIDLNHLERVRSVYEDKDGGARVSEDVWPRDKDALFPLQAALGYQLAQALFLSKRQLIVEELTDYWLVKAVAQALRLRKLPSLREDIAIVPAGGVARLLPLASMLIGYDVEIAALLHGDEPGRRDGKQLFQKLLAGDDRRCFFIGDFIGAPPHIGIEDVFPEQEYLSAVEEAYPKANLSFELDEVPPPSLVAKVEACFRRQSMEFDRWRPAQVLRDRILEAPDKLPEKVCNVMAKVFDAINAVFSVHTPLR